MASVNFTRPAVTTECPNSGPASTTMNPHKARILEMHSNSQSNAVIYVLVVLVLYAIALAIVLIKYVRRERYEARLYHLYDEFMRRDRFLRLSKRHSSVQSAGTPTMGSEAGDDETTGLRSPGGLRKCDQDSKV